MHGSDRVPDLNLDCERAWVGKGNGMAAILGASETHHTMVGLIPWPASFRRTLGTARAVHWPWWRQLEQTFQIVIVVLVQTANGDLFPGTLQLAFYIAVIRTGPGFQS